MGEGISPLWGQLRSPAEGGGRVFSSRSVNANNNRGSSGCVRVLAEEKCSGNKLVTFQREMDNVLHAFQMDTGEGVCKVLVMSLVTVAIGLHLFTADSSFFCQNADAPEIPTCFQRESLSRREKSGNSRRDFPCGKTKLPPRGFIVSITKPMVNFSRKRVGSPDFFGTEMSAAMGRKRCSAAGGKKKIIAACFSLHFPPGIQCVSCARANRDESENESRHKQNTKQMRSGGLFLPALMSESLSVCPSLGTSFVSLSEDFGNFGGVFF